ncbi:hypothetical protein MLD38_029491 [Melastoma candidum]|uniref:Uncharacterized protein n=1 Tax=Melastoma candidum TaxID=119954 RepID=A0ACB9N5L0_9MYRT|nr:hypothetical protein MLD38_029491 [Melastoma candidum]
MAMAVVEEKSAFPIAKQLNRGAWTPEEDKKLAEVIAVHGAKRWRAVAAKAGLKRCGKSCRLRWMNYLRPNIKRGNITDQEEDLILRLHKLLGNRWSLIAGRLPGRTDNEIKNYWNSHLSKRMSQASGRRREGSRKRKAGVETLEACPPDGYGDARGGSSAAAFDVDEFFDFSNENPLNLEWVSRFLQHDTNQDV